MRDGTDTGYESGEIEAKRKTTYTMVTFWMSWRVKNCYKRKGGFGRGNEREKRDEREKHSTEEDTLRGVQTSRMNRPGSILGR